MAQWVEVKVRYEKLSQEGKTIRVTEPYLVDTLSCTDAEARVVKELTPYISGEFNVIAVNKTQIADVLFNEAGDKFFKAKLVFIVINEKTGIKKRMPYFILVEAPYFEEAYHRVADLCNNMVADCEIESISETKYIDAFKYEVADANPQQRDDV